MGIHIEGYAILQCSMYACIQCYLHMYIQRKEVIYLQKTKNTNSSIQQLLDAASTIHRKAMTTGYSSLDAFKEVVQNPIVKYIALRENILVSRLSCKELNHTDFAYEYQNN